MQAKEGSVAPEEVTGRMVLGRMVLGITDSGRVVLEGLVSEGKVSGEGARPPVAIESAPSAGAERENCPDPDSRRTA
jgi:hypothetical protein